MATIKKTMDLMESMFYYWKATSEKEKVGEKFIYTIADNEAMQVSYDTEFGRESVRKTLSALSNREIFSPACKKEGRFWNNNMWMMEDLSVAEAMMAPIKLLNLDHLVLPGNEVYEVMFIPGHFDTFYMDVNKKCLVVNFFKIMVDFGSGVVNLDGQPLSEAIASKLVELAG